MRWRTTMFPFLGFYCYAGRAEVWKELTCLNSGSVFNLLLGRGISLLKQCRAFNCTKYCLAPSSGLLQLQRFLLNSVMLLSIDAKYSPLYLSTVLTLMVCIFPWCFDLQNSWSECDTFHLSQEKWGKCTSLNYYFAAGGVLNALCFFFFFVLFQNCHYDLLC